MRQILFTNQLRLGRLAFGCAAMICFSALLVAPLAAQDNDAEAPFPEENAEGPCEYVELDANIDHRRSRNRVSRMLRPGNGFGANRPLFDAYFNEFFLPSFSRLENLGKLPELREKLRDFFRSTAGGPAGPANTKVHNRLLLLAYSKLMGIARGAQEATLRNGEVEVVIRQPIPGGRIVVFNLQNERIPNNEIKGYQPAECNFHPAVRYNAMLAIGDMHLAMANRRAKIEPWPMAFDPMLKMMSSTKYPEYMRVAAMIGVEKHATPDRNEGAKQLIAADLIKILEAPTTARTSDGERWMKRRAADILGKLESAGPRGSNVAALDKALADRGGDLQLRCAAAGAISRMKTAALGEVDANELVTHVAALLQDAGQRETAASEGGAPAIQRNRMLHALNSADAALTWLLAANGVDAEAKQAAESTQTQVQSVITAVADQEQDATSVFQSVQGLMRSMEHLLQEPEPVDEEQPIEEDVEAVAEEDDTDVLEDDPAEEETEDDETPL